MKSSKDRKIGTYLSLPKGKWFLLVTRPLSIFGNSISNHWYHSQLGQDLIGVDHVLAVEVSEGLSNRYHIREQYDSFNDRLFDLLTKNPSFIEEELRKALDLNRKAQKILEARISPFCLRTAVDFCSNISVPTTIVARPLLQLMQSRDFKIPEISHLCESLTSVSYYTRIIEEIIFPLAIQYVGLKNEQDLNLLTISELFNKEIKIINFRKKAKNENQKFIYYSSLEKEKVFFVKNTNDIVNKISGISPKEAREKELKGQTACLGRVTGIARVVVSNLPGNTKFNDEDILVSIQCSPNLSPLIEKCSAIVADEGGITCHAAILAREFNKPCVMGTKYATQVIKDGDLIEVDADNGIVRILS